MAEAPLSDRELEHSKLRSDLEAARHYGASHPDDFVEVLFVSEPSVRIVVLVSDENYRMHEAALRELVPHPDQLEVSPTRFPIRRLEEIRQEVHDMATTSHRGAFSEFGIGHDLVEIRLAADQQPLALSLHERCGDAEPPHCRCVSLPARLWSQ